jgi:hypothetical protein
MTPDQVENLTDEEAKEYLIELISALVANYGPDWRYEVLGDG